MRGLPFVMDDDAGGLNNNGANMTNYYLKLHYMVAMMTAPSSNFFFLGSIWGGGLVLQITQFVLRR